MESYSAHALGPATWDACAALVERHNGVWGGGWCFPIHLGPDIDRAVEACTEASGGWKPSAGALWNGMSGMVELAGAQPVRRIGNPRREVAPSFGRTIEGATR